MIGKNINIFIFIVRVFFFLKLRNRDTVEKALLETFKTKVPAGSDGEQRLVDPFERVLIPTKDLGSIIKKKGYNQSLYNNNDTAKGPQISNGIFEFVLLTEFFLFHDSNM